MDKIDSFDTLSGMSRLPPIVLVICVWAAIYLPALGSYEIRGEEGRRILPAMAMLESGNYITPHVGGGPYFRKPPLVNWMVAAAFKLTGIRNEWTARMPSVLAVLAVALVFVTVARNSLGRGGSVMAALIWLTNLGMLEKGRLIEIEALYVSLCAIAIVCWLSWWQEQRSPWLTWTVPWLFVGIGMLAKGPALLIFFYAVVLAVLISTNKTRLLLHPAHLLGLVIMGAIVSAWAIPILQSNEKTTVLAKWSGQFTGRVTGEFFHFSVWILTLPRALGYFLPWLVFVPLMRFRRLRTENERQLARSLAWSVAVPLVGLSLIPGAAPRYTLPAITPFCWLLALMFTQDAFVRPAWLRWPKLLQWSPTGMAIVGAVVAVGLVGFPLGAFAFKRPEKVRSVAEKINAQVPPAETLYAVDPNYQPLFFYIHSPVKYVSTVDELPYEARYFLVRPDNEQAALAAQQWAPRRPEPVTRVKDYRRQTVILFRVAE